jgi:hypothetical protein
VYHRPFQLYCLAHLALLFPKIFKIFGLPIFWSSGYRMKIIMYTDIYIFIAFSIVSWSLCVQWVIVRGSSPFCWYWPTICFNFLIDKKCTYLCSYLKQNKQLYYKVYCNNFNKLLTILLALQTSYGYFLEIQRKFYIMLDKKNYHMQWII